ncbi:histidine phosphatase family protein [Beutenbergia cavernae]|uniref:histidine phosphatase family protein n=1 Tax=Beutenbergia cavernae TaxID=84757 RepID=UPI00117D10F1|nr:histidine phosphatase family protein [Beutenbergia cavernae]
MAARRVHLLRHAMPAARPDADPRAWPLSDEGRAAAARLAGTLPAGLLLSSTEAKAVETITLAAGPPTTDARFGEVSRPGEPFDDAVVARRRAWVESRLDVRHAGWETPDEAAARFDAGVRAYPGEDMVIATHGMVMVAWLARVGVVSAGAAAGELWIGLAFPDLVTVCV